MNLFDIFIKILLTIFITDIIIATICGIILIFTKIRIVIENRKENNGTKSNKSAT